MPIDPYFTSARPFRKKLADLAPEIQSEVNRLLDLPYGEQDHIFGILCHKKWRDRTQAEARFIRIHIRKNRDRRVGAWQNAHAKYVERGPKIIGGMQKV